jgi:hypothetical protein
MAITLDKSGHALLVKHDDEVMMVCPEDRRWLHALPENPAVECIVGDISADDMGVLVMTFRIHAALLRAAAGRLERRSPARRTVQPERPARHAV